MKLYPKASYYWFLDQDALIMNPAVKVETDIMHPRKLDQIMVKGQSIVPPNSIITTFAHLRGEQIHFALTQDKDGLSTGSWIVRNDDWGKFMLDTWFDPLYRSYNFARAETHALVSQIIQAGSNSMLTSIGTYCSMAPNHTRTTCNYPTAHYELVQPSRNRSCWSQHRIQGGRLCCQFQWM